MNKAIGKVTMVCVCLALPLIGSSRDAGAQGGSVMTYPRSGQSQDQHDRDRMECSQSASDSTGFDPLFEAQWLARSQGQLHSSVTSPAPGANGAGAVGGAAIGARRVRSGAILGERNAGLSDARVAAHHFELGVHACLHRWRQPSTRASVHRGNHREEIIERMISQSQQPVGRIVFMIVARPGRR